ncbi:MAG: hypothetical protein AAGB34_05925, partial [Planctomycetota bacterium]
DNNWQFDPYGGLEVGPESRLARRLQTVAYDILDLLYVAPDFTNAPTLDLNVGGGDGGGGSGLFQQGGGDDGDLGEDQQETVEDLIELVQTYVEPEHWSEVGGPFTIRPFRTDILLIRAAPFAHRHIGGATAFYDRNLSSRAQRWYASDERVEPIEMAMIEEGTPIFDPDPEDGESAPTTVASEEQPETQDAQASE